MTQASTQHALAPSAPVTPVQWLTFAVVPASAGSVDADLDSSEPILCLPWRDGRAPVASPRLEGSRLLWRCHDGACEGIDLAPVFMAEEIRRRLQDDGGLLTMEVSEAQGAVTRFAMRCAG